MMFDNVDEINLDGIAHQSLLINPPLRTQMFGVSSSACCSGAMLCCSRFRTSRSSAPGGLQSEARGHCCRGAAHQPSRCIAAFDAVKHCIHCKGTLVGMQSKMQMTQACIRVRTMIRTCIVVRGCAIVQSQTHELWFSAAFVAIVCRLRCIVASCVAGSSAE